MKRLLILVMPLMLAACFTLPDKKEIEKKLEENVQLNDYIYTDSRDTYSVTRSVDDKGPIGEEGTVSMVAFSDGVKTAGGSYEDHFKEGDWIYNDNITNITTVTWGRYEIGKFGIKTNLSIKGTTSTIDDHTELYYLPVKEDSILIRFYADTLAARGKRRPYEDILTAMMQQKGYALSGSDNKILSDSIRVISISSLTFTDTLKHRKDELMEVASAQLPTGFLAFATNYHEDNEYAAQLMFDGVLTNLYLNGERFYYPFKKNEKYKNRKQKKPKKTD